jgi:hypothetical protein
MGMSGVSKTQVSRLCEEIDERITAFLDRPIEGDWPYLWIDATHLKVRQNGRLVSVATIIAEGVEFSAWTSAAPRPRHSGPSSCASCVKLMPRMPRRHEGRGIEGADHQLATLPAPTSCAMRSPMQRGGAGSPPSSPPPLRKTTRCNQAAMAQSRRPVATLPRLARLMNEVEPDVLAFMSFPTSD